MKSTGIIRSIDNLGRLVLPKEMRDAMDIKNQDGMEIFVSEDKIILQKYYPACIFCAKKDDSIVYFKGKMICGDCVADLKKEK